MNASRSIRKLALSAFASLFAVCGACLRPPAWPSPPDTATNEGEKAPTPPPPPATEARALYGDHPRLLLTPERIAAARAARTAKSASWSALAARCDEASGPPLAAGYQGWDWANAALDLAVCDAVAPRPEYARAALRYFRALLDDRFVVGDGAGGETVVQHDDGYPIRTYGCLGALAFDWLHDAPGMTGDLRRHAIDRFAAWTRWFGDAGYNRDDAVSNYYVGWFAAVAFAGIAGYGDDPRAAALLDQASRMFAGDIAPAYGSRLAGGDFPEGWQYGDLVATLLAIFVDAQSRAGARPSFGDLPWLSASVEYRAHALWPDGKHMFDTGDWSDKPATAPAHSLAVLSMVLPQSAEPSRKARGLARLARDPGEEWHWLDALALDPSRPAANPRAGATSYLGPGTATMTARTDWSAAAVWMAMTGASSLSDHQHLDAGHFEVVRGADALIVDSGGYGSYSSLSHNVIAVDDAKENDVYSPNQGRFGHAVGITRYADLGRFVAVLADVTGAYDPPGFPDQHPGRSVARAEREIVFARRDAPGPAPSTATMAVYDRLTLAKPSYQATFLLHGGAPPEIHGRTVRIAVGRSAATVTSILSQDGAPVLVREPTNLGDGPYYANEPPEGQSSTRVEEASPVGDTERRFLHVIVASAADLPSDPPSPITGDAVDGAAIGDEAFVFARGGPQRRPSDEWYRAPSSATHHVVASLAPGADYAVAASLEGDDCRVAIHPADGARDALRASDAGTIALDLGPGCSLTMPVSAPGAGGAR